MINLVGIPMGLMIGTICPNVETTSALLALLFLPLIGFIDAYRITNLNVLAPFDSFYEIILITVFD